MLPDDDSMDMLPNNWEAPIEVEDSATEVETEVTAPHTPTLI
jgi:hypothetical protein